jgi:uncharacterized protein (UPF0216 family)
MKEINNHVISRGKSMDEMLDTKKAMAYLDVGRTKLYKYIAEKKLTVYRRKDNAKLSYFSKEELDRIKNESPEFVPAAEFDPKNSPVTAL